MFAKLDKGIIFHTRGDTFSSPLYLFEGKNYCPQKVTLDDEDTVYFAIVEPHQSFEDAIVRKKYTTNSLMDDEGNILIRLDSKDTEYLHTGTYYYTVKLLRGTGEILTLIPLTLFTLIGTDRC